MTEAPWRKRRLATGALALCLAAGGLACGDLGNVLYGNHTGVSRRPSPPEVRLVETRLVHAPTNEQLGLHFCRVQASRAAGPLGAAACRALGSLPSREDLQFVFEVELEAENPGRVPLPMVSALVAFRAFPDSGEGQQLGAVCMTLCESATSCPQRGPSACESEEPEIRDMDSFAEAATGFLVSVALGEHRFADLTVRTIEPADRVRFVARLSLDIEPALRVIEWAATDAIESAQRGQVPAFTIPYEVEGTVFVEVREFGRFAGSFPATRGTWPL